MKISTQNHQCCLREDVENIPVVEDAQFDVGQGWRCSQLKVLVKVEAHHHEWKIEALQEMMEANQPETEALKMCYDYKSLY